MSDEIIVKDKGDFIRELPPAGPINAVCWKTFNCGLQPNKLGPAYHVVVIAWETEYRYETGDYKGKRWMCYQKYRASLGKKAYLRRDLENWRGAPFTDEELKGFNVRKVEGKPALLTLIHKDGYANLAAVSKLPKVYTPMTTETPSDYMPPYVKKLLDQQIVDEGRTDEVGERGPKASGQSTGREPTKEEIEMF